MARVDAGRQQPPSTGLVPSASAFSSVSSFCSRLLAPAGHRVLAKRVFTRSRGDDALQLRLALLGATGLVLSAASGYTTWDGMHITGDAFSPG